MPSTILTIHYPTLEKVLDDAEVANPDRTKSYLDIMRENFAKNAFEVLQGDTAILEINHDQEHVTILGEELKGDYYGLPDSSLEQDEQAIIYDNIINAIEHAKDLGKYDEIFKEVIPSRSTS